MNKLKVNSKNPKKQRNAVKKLKNHQVSKLFTVPLSKELQAEWGIKRLPVRTGDTVRVVKGDFVDIEGEVLEKNKKNLTVTIEECTIEKRDGSEYSVPISVSKLLLTQFGGKKNRIEDPWRRDKMIERKEKLVELGEEKEE